MQLSTFIGVGAVETRTISFLNRCAFPIWIHPLQSAVSPPLIDGIPRIEPNDLLTLNIFDSGWAGSFWPKTDCDSNGANCTVGQSEEPCPSTDCQPSANTKVEFYFPPKNNSRTVWYDISLVDGYTLPMEIIPSEQVSILRLHDNSIYLHISIGRIVRYHKLCYVVEFMSF